MEYGKKFSMKWSKKWKIFSMEWKKFCCMEYKKIVFHCIPWHALFIVSIFRIISALPYEITFCSQVTARVFECMKI